MAKEKAKSKKSGLRKLKKGESLFKENDYAQSLYIIQKGQIRLFRPKGSGFVELAVLRAGEVIGEMAFFDEDGSGRSRSASAEALVETEIIEISFEAFGKTIDNLNPWFQTIFNTLASRLRKTNAKVKALESNSVSGYGVGGKSEYKFFQNHEIVRLLSLLYMSMKTHGEHSDDGYVLHLNTINFYVTEIFSIQEVKTLEFIGLLIKLGVAKLLNDQSKQPKVFWISDINILRELMIFINRQRTLADDKKMVVSGPCEIFLIKIVSEIEKQELSGDLIQLNVAGILKEFKEQKMNISVDTLADAKKQGFVGDAMLHGPDDVKVNIMYDYLKKNIINMRFINLLDKFNESKSGAQTY